MSLNVQKICLTTLDCCGTSQLQQPGSRLAVLFFASFGISVESTRMWGAAAYHIPKSEPLHDKP